jgi:hypothetical protein
MRDALADVWGDVPVAAGIVLGAMGVAIGFGPLLFSVFALAFGVGACAMGGSRPTGTLGMSSPFPSCSGL